MAFEQVAFESHTSWNEYCITPNYHLLYHFDWFHWPVNESKLFRIVFAFILTKEQLTNDNDKKCSHHLIEPNLSGFINLSKRTNNSQSSKPIEWKWWERERCEWKSTETKQNKNTTETAIYASKISE